MPSYRIPTTLPDNPSTEGSFRSTPLERVRSIFVAFYQGLFHAAPRGSYHWEPDVDDTEIYISDESPLRAETIGQRPAISVTRGPVQFYTLGFDDALSHDLKTGAKTKSVLVPGTMAVNACSRVRLESENIAWVCAEQLWLHREMLLAAGFFDIGQRPAIGAPTPAGSIVAADSGDEWYVTAVTFPFQFYRTSQTYPLGKSVVNNIEVSVKTRLGLVRTEGPVPDPVSGPPYKTEGTRPPPHLPNASDVYGNTPNPGGSYPSLPLVPHPLNPSQLVVIRSSRPYSPSVKPPSMGGRTIPITRVRVEESDGQDGPRTVVTSKFKV